MEDFNLFIRLWLSLQSYPIGNELHFTCVKDCIPTYIYKQLKDTDSEEKMLRLNENTFYITIINERK